VTKREISKSLLWRQNNRHFEGKVRDLLLHVVRDFRGNGETKVERWHYFFPKSVAKIEIGHLFCPFLKKGKTFPKKGSRRCIIEI
jgi:hypothetical protein